MGGGGTAPKMKMSDAFILTGLTLLLGGLFMHTWVTPVNHAAEDPPYSNGASMMKGERARQGVAMKNAQDRKCALAAAAAQAAGG